MLKYKEREKMASERKKKLPVEFNSMSQQTSKARDFLSAHFGSGVYMYLEVCLVALK